MSLLSEAPVFSTCHKLGYSNPREAWGLGLRVLKGSWDLVTRVIIKVTILIVTYN